MVTMMDASHAACRGSGDMLDIGVFLSFRHVKDDNISTVEIRNGYPYIESEYSRKRKTADVLFAGTGCFSMLELMQITHLVKAVLYVADQGLV